MSAAIYCDKCGKLFKAERIKVVKVEFIGYASQETEAFEFCESCHDKLEDFLR